MSWASEPECRKDPYVCEVFGASTNLGGFSVRAAGLATNTLRLPCVKLSVAGKENNTDMRFKLRLIGRSRKKAAGSTCRR